MHPSTFNEKIQARKIFDNRPLFQLWADKMLVRQWVAERAAADLLPRLLHATTFSSHIPFDSLPERCVVKASHGSGWVHIERDGRHVDRDALIRKCDGWLDANYYEVAELLSSDVDFVRVDPYEAAGRIYFGEMTPSSGNGFNKFTPISYDRIFGSYWKSSSVRPSWIAGGHTPSADARHLGARPI